MLLFQSHPTLRWICYSLMLKKFRRHKVHGYCFSCNWQVNKKSIHWNMVENNEGCKLCYHQWFQYKKTSNSTKTILSKSPTQNFIVTQIKILPLLGQCSASNNTKPQTLALYVGNFLLLLTRKYCLRSFPEKQLSQFSTKIGNFLEQKLFECTSQIQVLHYQCSFDSETNILEPQTWQIKLNDVPKWLN